MANCIRISKLSAIFMQLIFLIFFLISCSGEKSEKDLGIPVAKVKNKILYSSELSGIVPEGLAGEDSIYFIKQYIENWVKENTVLIKAEENLTAENLNIEKKIEDYRKSLIIYAYEQAFVSQNLDTNIAETEIEKYFEENKSNFELKDNIIKVTYVKVNKKAPKIDKLKQLYKSTKEEDLENLKNYCLQYAESFYIDNNTWLFFDDLLKAIPIKLYDKESFLQNNRYIELSDSSSFYFVNIKGFQIKNSVSPLSFEKENIRNIIINKRKIDLIAKMKEGVYKEALGKNEIEIY